VFARLPSLAASAALPLTPWPSALLVRRSFDATSRRTAEALARHVPDGVSARYDERYDDEDDDALLDVFSPSHLAREQALPTVVWVHGGGWLSGNQRQIENYARILASRGYTVVSVNYSLAPRFTYPKPVRQIVRALEYLKHDARRLHVDAARFFLAGDSAGAQLAAQVANLVSAPSYAAKLGIHPPISPSELLGVVLYCGAYDLGSLDLDGELKSFLRTVLWAYSGTKAFETDRAFETFSVRNFVTTNFPATFISSGNRDPITSQSRALAAALVERGVEVDTLFFPDSYRPPLEHEYQFDLDTEAGKLALERSLAFLAARSRPAALALRPGA
jgi:acetyl esterase/lipase